MTTTIVPTPTATIPLTATLESPFHHGAGSSGNTSLLRTQDVVQPDGAVARVPFLSAASVRHGLRDALAWHLARTLPIEEGSLPKAAVDLLWTGGAVTSTGAVTDLEMARRVENVLPMLGLLGYAAQSSIVTGTLRASDLILVCAENDARLPAELRGARRAATYRGEEFGTRHDQADSPIGRYIDAAGGGDTAQMIWDTQVVITGARLHGELSLTPAATDAHRMVLGAALWAWAPGGRVMLGAKTGQGFGRATITGPDWVWCRQQHEVWTEHVREHAGAIRDLIADLSR